MIFKKIKNIQFKYISEIQDFQMLGSVDTVDQGILDELRSDFGFV